MTCDIIDFHTHPFDESAADICQYRADASPSADAAANYLKSLGIRRICGSVLYRQTTSDPLDIWPRIARSNEKALELSRHYGDFYIPGFHVHPDHVRRSCEEIERMHKLGVHLIGELVPYMYGWQDYSSHAFDEILDAAGQYRMVVSFHSMDNDAMDTMVQRHPNTVLVAAHPGEKENYLRHLRRMEMSENYYLDLSGTGLFRHRMLRWGIDRCGIHRFLFGSDYPVCSPAMNIGAIALDPELTEEEKQQIFSGNTKRLLGLP